MEYKIIRSLRKTLALQVKDAELIVRAPYRKTEKEIKAFVEKHEDWIRRTVEAQTLRLKEPIVMLTRQEIDDLIDDGNRELPKIVEFYAQRIGVTYDKVRVKVLRSKWGSCSGNGNLSFNCLLMLAPREVIESVVVHELCHRKQMNHSEKFYKEVLRVYPDYYKYHKWLKEHGTGLIRRIPD